MPKQKQSDLILSTEQGWGKINAGQRYGILADDIATALSLAGLNKAEARLFDEIRQRSWGESARRKRPGQPWPEARPAPINLSELARQLDPDRAESWRRMLMRAKAALVKDRLISETPAGFLILKDIDQWARLTDADRRYVATKRTPGVGLNGHTPRDYPVTPPRDQSVTPPVTDRSHPPGPISHTPRDRSVTGALIGTRASEISSEDLRRHSVCETGGAHTEIDLSPEEEAEAERERLEHEAWRATQKGRHTYVVE